MSPKAALQHDKPMSRLLLLPAELRTRIYELLLLQPNGVTVGNGSKGGNQRALLCVSRQVNHEAAPVCYRDNILYCEAFELLPRWIYSIGSINRSLLREVRLQSACTPTYFYKIGAWIMMQILKHCYEELVRCATELHSEVLRVGLGDQYYSYHQLETSLGGPEGVHDFDGEMMQIAAEPC